MGLTGTAVRDKDASLETLHRPARGIDNWSPQVCKRVLSALAHS